MFTLFPRSNALRNWPLSLGLLFVATPVISASAKAQTASLKPSASEAPDAPQLTDGVRPGSAIAASERAAVRKAASRNSRSLVMSLPDPTLTAKPVVLAPVSATASTLRTSTAPPAPTRLPALPAVKSRRVVVDAPPVIAPKAATPPGTTLPDRLAAIDALDPAPDWATSAPRDTPREKAARLSARGGPILNPGMVQVNPGAAVVTPPPAVSESQRLMLARLDADLAKAQSRLNRAETRLSEGQRQLGDFTSVLQSAMLEAGDDARGLHPFVRVAQRYLGTPYVWGGESARGFDCSGFIMRVMRDLGYRALPHSAAEQFRYGMPIAKPLLKPGDVVFFANTYKPGISHVGIYLGRGRFIHAANSKVGTIVSALSEPKWVEKYAGARRLLPVNS